jgi:hypothetical protein
VARAYERAQEFRIGPYLDAQESFVADAHAALSSLPEAAQDARSRPR